jgi:hypothetical protein
LGEVHEDKAYDEIDHDDSMGGCLMRTSVNTYISLDGSEIAISYLWLSNF